MGKPLRDYAYDAAMLVLSPLERVVMSSSKVDTTPFLPVEDFPFARVMEASWRVIREELDGVLEHRRDLPAFHEISSDVADISDENWRTFFFYGYGFRSDANCRRCPRTAELVEQIPGMKTAMFSILEPGKRIPPHRGPWTGVLRYHLGLKIPDPALCGIEVGGVTARWHEGESLIFDDHYEHRAWNDSPETRAVLFVDLMRPCRPVGDLVNRAVISAAAHSPFLADARRKHRAWERRYAELHPLDAPAGAEPRTPVGPATR